MATILYGLNIQATAFNLILHFPFACSASFKPSETDVTSVPVKLPILHFI